MNYGTANSIHYYRRVTTQLIRDIETKATTEVKDSNVWSAMVDKFWDACDTQNLRDIEQSHRHIKKWHRQVLNDIQVRD